MTNLTRESHLDNNDEDMHCDYLESHRKWPDFGSHQYFVAFIQLSILSGTEGFASFNSNNSNTAITSIIMNILMMF